jgi:RHS repeat-associated protein
VRRGLWLTRLHTVLAATVAATVALLGMTTGPVWAAEFQRDAQSYASSAVSTVSAAESTFTDNAADWSGDTSQTGGDAGDWSATDLSSAGSWVQGGSSGAYSYTYSMRVPPATGPVPKLALSYSSASHDGLTSGTNNQASWIGDGWGYSPGFVERTYVGCGIESEQDGNNGEDPTGDLCWDGDSPSITLSLNGTNTALVLDDETGEWRAATDTNWRIEKLGSPATASAPTTERWQVTLPDGTVYTFAADPSNTGSRWAVPVFGNHSGEACYVSGDFADSRCNQAYRWLLDRAVDVHGNMTRYVYGTETGYYSPNVDSEADAVAYTRSGWLKRIEYGLRSDDPTVHPTGRVQFFSGDRCVDDCYDSSGDPKEDNWPDVPWDRDCEAGTGCEQYSPAFFSTNRLGEIRTEVWNTADGVFDTVDSWTLTHEIKDYGHNSQKVLWLAAIQHTGHVGGEASTPPIEFGGTFLPNTVDDGSANPMIWRPRLTSIKNETGGVTTVNYSTPECGVGNLPTDPEANTLRCYPTWYTPDGLHQPVEAYFHKYVVASIAETDTTAGADTVWTTYEYSTAGGGTSVLWAWNDSEFTDEDKRTYNQWRGYTQVTTLVGDPADTEPRLRSATRYYRGLDGQPLPDDGERDVTVTSTRGDTAADHEALIGRVWEQITYEDATVIGSAVTDYWIKNTATRSHDGGELKAWMTGASIVEARTKLSDTAWQTTRSETTFDDYGRVDTVSNDGNVALSGDEQCVDTQYADNTTAWILNATSRVETLSVTCDDESVTRPDDVISDARTYYDGEPFGAAPSDGLVTKSETLDTWDSGPQYETVAEFTYDELGREVTVHDALGAMSKAEYTPAGPGPVTQMVITNALGHKDTIVNEPAWGAIRSVTDPNGQTTSASYDALGRRTAVWFPGQSQSSGEVPNLKFTYAVSDTVPSATTTETMIWDQSYLTEIDLYDALMRPRQTQAETYGGRLITQIEYNSRGQVVYESGANYNNDSGPTADLVRISRSNDVARTEYAYDNAGRVTDQIAVIKDEEQWRTTTAYGGHDTYFLTTVTPPDGASATASLTDARGKTVEIWRYHANTPTGTPDVTAYTYTGGGQLATVTDPDSNTWTFGYDLRGRQTSADDPDSGVLAATYNNAGQVTSTTTSPATADETVLAYEYDALGRQTALWEDAIDTGTPLAEWSYDSATNGTGLPYQSTNWVDGEAWTQEIRAYTAEGWVNQTYTHLPDGAGALKGSYWQAFTYHPDGSMRTSRAIGAGGLYPETMIYGYNEMGQASRVSGTGPNFGAGKVYVNEAVYSPYGQLLQRRLGDPDDVGGTSGQTWQTWIYEEGTGRLSEFYFDKDTAGDYDGTNYGVAALSYEYDDAGNILSITDEPVHTSEALAPETQCFQYDDFQRLTEAWTQAGTSDCAAAPVEDVIGGPASYWSSYAYDTTGNRTSENRWNGTSQTHYDYTFPEPGSDHPHALTEVTSEANSGERTAFTYNEAGYTTSIDRDGDISLLEWTPTGRLDTVTNGENVTQFIDDADGNRLARIDPDGSITAWVAGYELNYDATAGTVGATRYYTHGGSTVAVREDKGDILFLSGDHHGTGQWIVNGNTLTTKVRRFDPFGNDRSSTAWVERDGTYGSDTWPDDRGFVGGIQNDTTGLTTIGAREYDPLYGRFISVDPIADYTDPQQLNGYAYALNNPVTFADPTGECWTGPGGSYYYPGKCSDGSMSTYKDARAKGGGNGGSGGNGGNGDSGEPSTPAAPESPSSPENNTHACAPTTPTFNGEGPISAESGCGTPGSILDFGEYLLNGTVQAVYTLTVEDAVNCVNDPNWADCIFAVIGFVPGVGKIAGLIVDAILKYADELLKYSDEAAAGVNKACDSFAAGTLVLMADGTVKPIEEVKVGEEVLARDVAIGEAITAIVSDTITTPEQLRNLITIGVDIDGDGKSDADITSTAGHAFWAAERDVQSTDQLNGEWIHAAKLEEGNWLQDQDGNWLVLTDIRSYSKSLITYNFAVSNVHTYHVIAGETPVLVHNCNFRPGVADEKYDKHVLGLDNSGNPTRTPDMPEYDYDGGFEKYVEDACALMCGARPAGAREATRSDGVIIRLDSEGRIGMLDGNEITTFFRPDDPLAYFLNEAAR